VVIVVAGLLAIPLAGGDGGETTDTDPTTEPDTDPSDPTDPKTPETDVTTAPPVTDTVPETSTDFTLPTITDPTSPPTTTPETVLVTTTPPTTTIESTRPPRTTPTTTPGPGVPEFGEGTQLVGDDIEPGTYITPGTDGCYWERLSGLGGSTEEIIVNDFSSGQRIVSILPGDVAFNSDGCGRWTAFRPGNDPKRSFGQGDFAVGSQIQPGVYRSPSTTGDCYWERSSSFEHITDDIIVNSFGDKRPTVEIQQGDVMFSSSRCGKWTRV